MSERPGVPGAAMRGFERRIGRVLIALTYAAVALLIVGVTLMIVRGIGPLDGGPRFDPGAVTTSILALDPAGFLWVGIGLVLVTPITRVAAAGVAYAGQGQWRMVAVATGILVVIAIAIVTALVTET
jgi:uncharacterized membrane protein